MRRRAANPAQIPHLPPLSIPPIRSPVTATVDRSVTIEQPSAAAHHTLPQIDEQTLDDIIKDLGYRN